MIRNYFLLAIRNITRQKGYSLINILGLAIGLAACLFIVLFILDEFKYDKHHEKGDRIYRMVVSYKSETGENFDIPIQSYRLRESLQLEFPEMEKVTRVTMPYDLEAKYENTDQRLEVSAVDDDYMDMFNLAMVHGDKNTALDASNGIILSRTSAERFFGDENPMEKMITLVTPMGNFPVQITGVFEDFPRTSHIHLDALFSTRVTDDIYNERQLRNWGEGTCYVYALLKEGSDPGQIESRMGDFVEKARGEGSSEGVGYYLQPLYDIHLRSHLRYEAEANGDIRYVYIFGIVALFILLIAAFNYMNLSTSRAIKRSREVGIRKLNGATRGQLIFQFSGEAVLFSFVSMWIALLLAELLMPYFNNLSGKELGIGLLNDWKVSAILVFVAVVIGFLAGLYPSFFLSRFKPVNALSGNVKVSTSNSLLRKVLVVVQFSISIFLIFSTLVIYFQYRNMRNARLGIDPSNVVITSVPNENWRTLKQELQKDPRVVSASALNKKPTRELSSNLSFKAEGLDENENMSIKIVTVDWDFFETIGNRIVEGRSFDRSYPSDERDAFIINESAKEYIGWDNAVGKWFETLTLDSAGVNWVERKGKVIGVAEDYYFESLHNEIRPVVYFIQENWINWMIIRINPEEIQSTLSFINDTWTGFNTVEEFQFSFYEEDIENLYRAEKRFFTIFITFAILAIFIASLGMLGLVSFTTEQRTKEIGIRKTLGASTRKVIANLTSDFLKLILISNLIAWPVAWFFMRQWLQDFPNRIEPGILFFIVSGLLAIVIALLTTLYHAYRAASLNPVKSLKYE